MSMARAAVLALALCVLAACGSGSSARKAGDGGSDATNRARIHAELGTAYYGNGQMSVALEELQEALAADPNYGPAHNQLGLVYMALNEDKLAQQSFERALKLDPNDSSANNNYGMFLCQRKRDKEAFKYFMAALKNPLYTTPENAYTNAGICAWLQGDDAKADEWLRKALSLQPNQPQALYYLAELTYKRGDYKTARSLLTRHLQVAQPSVDALWLGARVESRLGDRSALASYGTQLNNRYPNSAQTQAFNAGKFQ
jgi:type IV pilus assembly protein PilF